jgi:hypothetical protein
MSPFPFWSGDIFVSGFLVPRLDLPPGIRPALHLSIQERDMKYVIVLLLAFVATAGETRIAKIVRVMDKADAETKIRCQKMLDSEIRKELAETRNEISRIKHEISFLRSNMVASR